MQILVNPKKSLGQNFLVDKNIVNKIIKIGNINKNKLVLEIGSGYGHLTESIIAAGPKEILSVEKDKNLSKHLKEKFKGYKKIKIINQDILKLLEKNNFKSNYTIFGNLPYNVSTQILASLIMQKKWPPWYDVLILMFQKEVADRIMAKTNTKDFSRLTILANWRLDIKKHFDVSRNSFLPKPKINSTILSFRPKKFNQFNLKNPKNLETITRIFFSNRRKMINKCFNRLFGKNMFLINKLNIDLQQRPENLSKETYYKIAMEYEKLFNQV